MKTVPRTDALRPRCVMLRLKANECLELANEARHSETKLIFIDLARSYGHLAVHAERSEQDRQAIN